MGLNTIQSQANTTTSPPAFTMPTQTTSVTPAKECAGCGKRITDRFLLKALDIFWHEDCLKCGCCDCRLGEVGSTLYTKANLILCKRDYLRLFGSTGYCSACNKMIPAFEMVMRAKNNVYHLECFACQQCNHRWENFSIPSPHSHSSPNAANKWHQINLLYYFPDYDDWFIAKNERNSHLDVISLFNFGHLSDLGFLFPPFCAVWSHLIFIFKYIYC